MLTGILCHVMVFPPTKLGISKGKLPAMDKGKILEKARQEGILGIDEGTKGRKDLRICIGKNGIHRGIYCDRTF